MFFSYRIITFSVLLKMYHTHFFLVKDVSRCFQYERNLFQNEDEIVLKKIRLSETRKFDYFYKFYIKNC